MVIIALIFFSLAVNMIARVKTFLGEKMKSTTIKYAFGLLLLPLSITVFAQEDASKMSDVEEVVVVGSQIKGAKITGALPVSIISSKDIEAIGVDSGDDLLENIAEQGLNYFNEAEDASGGVNASRGDVGAYNLRSMGVGNTLTLLNGRRLVNSPGYQTELIGGDYRSNHKRELESHSSNRD